MQAVPGGEGEEGEAVSADQREVQIDAPNVDPKDLFDPGPAPNPEAWRPFDELFQAGEEAGSYELACQIAGGLVRKDERLTTIRAAWAQRKARAFRILEKLGTLLVKWGERLTSLDEGEALACKEIEGQKEFQLARLVGAAQTERFSKAWGMGKRSSHVTFATDHGPYTLAWKRVPDEPTWATAPNGKRDDEAIIAALSDRFSELGLFDALGQFVKTDEKLLAADLKKALRRAGEGAEVAVFAEELTEAILEEEAAGRLRYETFTKDEAGLPTSWTVYVRVDIEDELDGQRVRARDLMTWTPAVVPLKVTFRPAKTKPVNGETDTEEEQEDETDGES